MPGVVHLGDGAGHDVEPFVGHDERALEVGQVRQAVRCPPGELIQPAGGGQVRGPLHHVEARQAQIGLSAAARG